MNSPKIIAIIIFLNIGTLFGDSTNILVVDLVYTNHPPLAKCTGGFYLGYDLSAKRFFVHRFGQYWFKNGKKYKPFDEMMYEKIKDKIEKKFQFDFENCKLNKIFEKVHLETALPKTKYNRSRREKIWGGHTIRFEFINVEQNKTNSFYYDVKKEKMLEL